jgi:hypothetical protein
LADIVKGRDIYVVMHLMIARRLQELISIQLLVKGVILIRCLPESHPLIMSGMGVQSCGPGGLVPVGVQADDLALVVLDAAIW